MWTVHKSSPDHTNGCTAVVRPTARVATTVLHEVAGSAVGVGARAAEELLRASGMQVAGRQARRVVALVQSSRTCDFANDIKHIEPLVARVNTAARVQTLTSAPMK